MAGALRSVKQEPVIGGAEVPPKRGALGTGGGPSFLHPHFGAGKQRGGRGPCLGWEARLSDLGQEIPCKT